LVSDHGEIIAGHGRAEAAKLLGMSTVPTIALSHLTEDERRAYVLADNKLALNAGWDREILAIELQALADLNFDIEATGFSLAEVDFAIDELGESDPDGSDTPDDLVPRVSGPAISQRSPSSAWIGAICANSSTQGAKSSLSSRTWWFGTKPTVEWEPSIARNTS
jgi:hypothetical protein